MKMVLRQVSHSPSSQVSSSPFLPTWFTVISPTNAVTSLTCPIDERLLAAAKTDNETLIESAIDKVINVNSVDG